MNPCICARCTTWAAPGTSRPGTFDPQLWTDDTPAALAPTPTPDDAEGKG